MALIFWASAQSGGGSIPEWGHVLGHFFEYALLAALWLWALRPGMGHRSFAAAALITISYAISDEIHQSFVPGRFSDPVDVLVDALGAATALGGAYLVYARGKASTRRTQSQRDG